MAIVANYNALDWRISNATLRIIEIWGNKNGWTAKVGVFSNPKDEYPTTSILVHETYVDGANPFTLIYNKIANLPVLSEVKSDQTPINTETPSEVVAEATPEKKTVKTKKVKTA